MELVLAAVLVLLPGAGTPGLLFVGLLGTALVLAGVYGKAWERGPWQTWALYLLGWVLYNGLRARMVDPAQPVHLSYPIDIGLKLFGGNDLSVWLQQHVYRIAQVGPLDLAASIAYLSFYIVPHVAAFVLWRRSPERFTRYVRSVVVALALGLLIFYLFPTAPPWLAGLNGKLPHVYRILIDTTQALSPEAYRRWYGVITLNNAASMPSMQVAITWLIVFACRRSDPVPRAVSLIYAMFMVLAVVYLGEHYIADAIGGIVVAVIAWQVVQLRRPRFRRRVSADERRAREIAALKQAPWTGAPIPSTSSSGSMAVPSTHRLSRLRWNECSAGLRSRAHR
ncbi:MAG: inositol phosphorylceramide synthase [Chloroflexi bacterium]|nr:inositol phosphorylceramide synthase [Chloroflexota bacterium]